VALKRTPIPVDIQLEDEGRTIRILWEGGRQGTFGAFDLRAECPCALCVDELTGKRTLRREDVDPKVAATSVERVGRYALQFAWSDGHTTGIYSYKRLIEGGS